MEEDDGTVDVKALMIGRRVRIMIRDELAYEAGVMGTITGFLNQAATISIDRNGTVIYPVILRVRLDKPINHQDASHPRGIKVRDLELVLYNLALLKELAKTGRYDSSYEFVAYALKEGVHATDPGLSLNKDLYGISKEVDVELVY